MRIALGGIMHESNSFSDTPTTLACFESASLTYGDEILAKWGESHHEMAGFIEGGQRFGYDLHPTVMAWAMPSGAVTTEAFEYLVGELIRRTKESEGVEGLLLALHGAMVCEGFPDGDGEVVERARRELGPEFPIVVTHDFHANISERIVHDSTALIVYKTNPHIDQRERGLQAAELVTRTIRGEVRPAQAMVKPLMVLNIRFHNTIRPPLSPVLDSARALEQCNPKVLVASFAGAYQYSDVHEMGPAAVVVTDDDPVLAQHEAQKLADMLWEGRESLAMDLPDAQQAVRRALCEPSPPPVILVDMGDNIGGGSAGDSTILLAELIEQEAHGWLVLLYDPQAVTECLCTGVRQPITLTVGGKTDKLHGTPVKISGLVRSIHDGLYEETEPRHGGLRFNDQGITAVVEVSSGPRDIGSLLVLTSKRVPPFSLQQIVSLGIDPSHRNLIVVKAAVAFRAAYEPLAGKIIEVDTPGLTCVNPGRFTYRSVRRPLWGLPAGGPS
ncbi:MAG: M81 family metallopeptidase [Armatimonadetes bacterium]|nr:M81 family metallopeptidase [Armatimonadota bacterium]